MEDKIKKMSVKEFRKQGYLQEVNRQFFHPLGLALEVVIEDDGSEYIGGVLDYRKDPEGVIFDYKNIPYIHQKEIFGKMENIKNIVLSRSKVRLEKLGYYVEPINPVDIEAEVRLTFRIGEPTVNGHIYEKTSFIKALKKAVKNGLYVYEGSSLYTETSKKIGKIINYNIIDETLISFNLDVKEEDYKKYFKSKYINCGILVNNKDLSWIDEFSIIASNPIINHLYPVTKKEDITFANKVWREYKDF